MIGLLQHNIEKFGMVTVMDVTLYDSTGKPVLFLDTLKMTNINTEGSNKEIRGGIGADLLISYDYGRTANLEMQDALISPSSLALLWGTKVEEGSVEYETKEEVVATAGVTNGILTLSDISIEGDLWVVGSDLDNAIQLTFTAGESEESLELTEGNSYTVYYTATGDAETKQIVLTNDNFPSALRMVGQTFVIDETTNAKKLIQIEIPKFKINSNFSFSMDAEGDASVFDFSGVALSANGDILKVKYLGNWE